MHLIMNSSDREDVTLLHFPNLKDTLYLSMKWVIYKKRPSCGPPDVNVCTTALLAQASVKKIISSE